MKGIFYILQCKDGHYYIGSTNNIERRLEEHKRGNCKTTKSRLPIKLIYNKQFGTLQKARKFELFVKKQKSRKLIEKIMAGAFGPIV